MSTTHSSPLHPTLPHLHLRSPHVEWHELRHPLRALCGVACALGVAVATFAGGGLSAMPELRAPAAIRELGRDLRPIALPPQPVDPRGMYGRHTRARDLHSMYAIPARQRY